MRRFRVVLTMEATETFPGIRQEVLVEASGRGQAAALARDRFLRNLLRVHPLTVEKTEEVD